MHATCDNCIKSLPTALTRKESYGRQQYVLLNACVCLSNSLVCWEN